MQKTTLVMIGLGTLWVAGVYGALDPWSRRFAPTDRAALVGTYAEEMPTRGSVKSLVLSSDGQYEFNDCQLDPSGNSVATESGSWRLVVPPEVDSPVVRLVPHAADERCAELLQFRGERDLPVERSLAFRGIHLVLGWDDDFSWCMQRE